MVLWVFDGNMVGKWTNEPCNGVDEVVNLFWVLTPTKQIKISIQLSFHDIILLCICLYSVDVLCMIGCFH